METMVEREAKLDALRRERRRLSLDAQGNAEAATQLEAVEREIRALETASERDSLAREEAQARAREVAATERAEAFARLETLLDEYDHAVTRAIAEAKARPEEFDESGLWSVHRQMVGLAGDLLSLFNVPEVVKERRLTHLHRSRWGGLSRSSLRARLGALAANVPQLTLPPNVPKSIVDRPWTADLALIRGA